MSILLLILLLFYVSQLQAKDNIVDVSYPSASDSTFPTLQAAIQDLVDSNGYFYDYNNTISLATTCASTELYLPALTLQSMLGGNLTITFLGTTTVTDVASCSELPSLVLSDISYLNVSSLDYFSISGVSIQYTGSVYLNQLSQISTVAFSNFCFNNSEPSGALSPSYYSYMSFKAIASFAMTSGIYLSDALKSLVITDVTKMTVDNVTFLVLAATKSTTFPAIRINRENNAIESMLTISDSMITCETGKIALPIIIFATNLVTAKILSTTIANCDFRGVAAKAVQIIYAVNTSTVLMDDITIANVSYGSITQQSVILISGESLIMLSNFHVNGLNISNISGQLNHLVEIGDHVSEGLMNISIENWEIESSNVSEVNVLLYIGFLNSANLGGLSLVNISIDNCYFYFKTNFLYFEITAPQIDTIEYQPITMNLSNITVNYSNIFYTDLFAFSYNSLYTVPAIELYQINLTNLTVVNCYLYQTDIFSIDGFFTSVTGALLYSSSLLGSSTLFRGENLISSFILMNSRMDTLTISDKSSIISFNSTKTRMLPVEAAYDDGALGLFAETRPFIVAECTFNNIGASISSVLIASNNPMITIQDNSFTKIGLNGSSLILAGGYIPFYSSDSYLLIWRLNQYTYLPQVTSMFNTFTSAEEIMFSGYPEASALFNQARNNLSKFDLANSVYFISIQDNVFERLSVASTDFLVRFNNFQNVNGTIGVIGNIVTGVSLNSTNNLVMFSSQAIYREVFSNNTFYGLSIVGFMLSVETTYIDSLLIDAASLTESTGFAGFTLNSDTCNTIQIQEMQVFEVQSETNLMKIDCGTLTNQIAFYNSSYMNIIETGVAGIFEVVNFLFILIRKPAPSQNVGVISFENNVFSNISLNNQEGHVKRLLDGSFFYILAAHCSITLQNDTFAQITVLPSSNILAISIATINILQSNFTGNRYKDVNGGLNLIFEELKINSTVFEDNQNQISNGAGLMSFINPDPETFILSIELDNCTFDRNYGNLIYVSESTIDLMMTSSIFLENKLMNVGGLFYIQNASDSNIKCYNCTFIVNQNQSFGEPNLNIFYIEGALTTFLLNISSSRLLVSGDMPGVLIYFYNNQYSSLIVNDLFISAFEDPSQQTNSSVASQYGVLVTDSTDAYFKDLVLSNLEMISPLFNVKCNTGDSKSSSVGSSDRR